MSSTTSEDQTVEQLARRIGPAARSARAHERFPYRPRPGHEAEDEPAIRDEIGEVLAGVDDMIHYLLARRFPDMQRRDREDAAQRVAVHLWRASIPKYDQYAGSKLGTYLYPCIKNYIRTIARDRHRAARRAERQRVEPLADRPIADPAPPSHLDARVHEIAEHVLAAPEKYMPPGPAAVLKALGHGEQPRQAVADAVGYASRATVSTRLLEARQAVAAIDIERFEPAVKPSSRKSTPEDFLRRFGIPIEEARRRRAEIENHITDRQRRIFAAILADPTVTHITLGRRLGIRPDGVEHAIRRTADRIAELDGKRAVPAGRTREPAAVRPLSEKLGVAQENLSYDLIRRIEAVLSPREWELFEAALDNPGLTTSQLAKRWGVRSPTVSVTLRHLRRKIERIVREADQ